MAIAEPNAGADTLLTLVVTCNFFRVYGLKSPVAGRTFTADECATPAGAASRVAVVSEEFLKDHFAADSHPVGSTLRLNRVTFTIVGILPAGFAGRIRGPGIWVPWTAQQFVMGGADLFRNDSTRWLTVEGRLKPGHSRSEARSELAVIAAQQDSAEPDRQTAMYLTNGSFAEEPAFALQSLLDRSRRHGSAHP